jgi:vacuolar-type H+-ATPase subunit E/Vma4
MSLDDLKRSLSADVAAETGRAEREYAAQEKEILDAARAEADRAAADIVKKAEQDAAEGARRRISTATLELSRRSLSERRKHLDSVFADVEKHVLGLPDADYAFLMSRVLVQAAETGEEEVLVGGEDATRLSPAFVDTANGELRKQERKGNLKAAGTSDRFRRGFCLRAASVETNCSLTSILARLKDEMEVEVASILFGKA